MTGRKAKRLPRPKAIPQRTCVGCRTVNPKRQLVRLVRRADGGVGIDVTGKAPGRGAYLHDRRACWTAALTQRALERALKTTVSEADRALLQAQSEQYPDDD